MDITGEVKPEDYTWSMAAKDVALVTPLTLREALDWTSWAELMGRTPYEATPLIVAAVNALPDVHVGPAFFGSLAALAGGRD